MLTLWYIILGWKEYNKPFRKVDQTPKPAEPAKKPDLIPLKKDAAPTKPTDIKPPQPQPPPKTPEPSFFNNKPPETPKIPETKPTPPPPKTPEVPKLPESFKSTPKTPEIPKAPEIFKSVPKTPDLPKNPEPPKLPLRTPEVPAVPDFKLAPEPPKKPESPKTPEPPKTVPKPADTFRPDLPKTPEGLPKTMPSRSPDAGMPDIPFSGKNPAFVPPTNQSEFPLPPYLPGTPQNKPLSKDDELFAMGNAFSTPSPNKPMANLRDLSYAKGEFPGEETVTKVKETITRIPKYMEQSIISNPDSLESDEEDEEF